jgi:hypothetical protein
MEHVVNKYYKHSLSLSLSAIQSVETLQGLYFEVLEHPTM